MQDELMDQWLALSIELTGFERVTLQGTGLASLYLETLSSVAGRARVENMLAVGQELIRQYGSDPSALEREIKARIMASPEFGPLAQNAITLWYLGSWNQLPQQWRNAYGASAFDSDRVVSSEAYQWGLLWTAGGTHPSGARQPGFGSWSLPPFYEDAAVVRSWETESPPAPQREEAAR